MGKSVYFWPSKPKETMFSGSITGKMDAKGRVFLPALFRRQLGASETQFVLRRDVHQPCLVIFPLKAWTKEVELLREKLNRWDARQAMVFRQFLGDSEQLQLDGAGRLLLSKHWLTAARLEREVLFVGLDDRIEIWPTCSANFLQPKEYAATVQEILGSHTD